jgi:phage terminase large subunit GpA-like protein
MLQVPEGVCILTAGVDVQGDRLVLAVYGWGEREQAWLIYYQDLWGKPTEPECWAQLKEVLDSTYVHASGRELRIYRCAVDSGAYTNEVYQFVRNYRSPWRSAHKVAIAVKGASKFDAPVCGKPSKIDVNLKGQAIKGGISLFLVGDNSTKTTIYGRLSLPRNDETVLGWFHFPCDAPDVYYEQLLGEEKKLIFNRGVPKETWRKKQGNSADALDATRYALAALYSLNAHLPKWSWESALDMGTVKPAGDDAKPKRISKGHFEPPMGKDGGEGGA